MSNPTLKRSLLIAFLSIFVFTIQAFPSNNNSENSLIKDDEDNVLEMVFVLDTTGSMGGLIEGAKQRIWGIVNDVMKKESKPRVRVGLVAYRDNEDDYVTKILPITEDLDKVYTTLMDYKADGGGDEPENVQRALAESVRKMDWSQPRTGLAQIIFLVGDARPHEYPQEIDVIKSSANAIKKNIYVNTIQCGNLTGTREVWQKIAQRGEGKYFAIAQDGGVQAISTPYDKELSELAQKIGKTYITYGTVSTQSANLVTVDATESRIFNEVTVSAQAERAVNKAVNTFSYAGDLLQEIENENIKLEDIPEDQLPEELKKLSPDERKKEVEKRIAERKEILKQILELSKKRDEFVEAERKKFDKKSGFDSAVSEALNEQLAKRGIK